MRDPVLLGGEPQRAAQTLLDRTVAAGAGEDERDGRQQALAIQGGDDVRPRRWPVQARTARPPTPAAGLPVGQPVCFTAVGDVAHQFGVHAVRRPTLAGSVVVEQVEQPLADQHVLPQRDRPVLVDHHGGVAAHGFDPAAELLGVAHRRRQAHQPHLLGQVQDDLLPHRATHPIGEEVHLIHHHVRETLQRIGTRVEHVAEHLGGHHHHRGVAVDRLVAGEQPDALGTVAADQVGVLLVAQRLDRRGVEAFLPGGQGQVDGELPHHRLARAGRSTHQHPVAAFEGFAGLHLERIEPERELSGEVGELAPRSYR